MSSEKVLPRHRQLRGRRIYGAERTNPSSIFFFLSLRPLSNWSQSFFFPPPQQFFFPNHYFGFFSFLSHKYARTFEKYLHNTKAACLQKAYPMLYKGSDQQFPPPLIMTRYRGNDGNVYSSENVVSTERDLLGKMLWTPRALSGIVPIK